MVSTITSLKYICVGLACFLCVFLLYALIKGALWLGDKIVVKMSRKNMLEQEMEFSERYFNAQSDLFKPARKIAEDIEYRQTLLYRLAFEGGLVCLPILGVCGKFIIERIGVVYYAIIVICLLLTLFYVLYKWQTHSEEAAEQLASYLDLFCSSSEEYRKCIRMAISPKYIQLEHVNILKAIYEAHPGIQDAAALSVLGNIISSDLFVTISNKIGRGEDTPVLSSDYKQAYSEYMAVNNNSSKMISGIKVAAIVFSIVSVYFMCLTFNK